MDKFNPILEREHPVGNGVQKVYRFENDYGASVVRFGVSGLASFPGGGSYGADAGLWELGVIKFRGEGELDFSLTYSTPITDDVLGYLSDDDVENTLHQIAALPKEA